MRAVVAVWVWVFFCNSLGRVILIDMLEDSLPDESAVANV